MNKEIIKTGLAWGIGAIAGALLINRIYKTGMAYYAAKLQEQEIDIIEEESLQGSFLVRDENKSLYEEKLNYMEVIKMGKFVLGMSFVGGLILFGRSAYELGKLHQKEEERQNWKNFMDAVIKIAEIKKEEG